MLFDSQIVLCRHGETAWSLSGQHTGLTDLPLTEKGRKQAENLGNRLRSLSFDHVLKSPLRRAQETCEQAGFNHNALTDKNLREFDYGAYEGLTSSEIEQKAPDWNLFRDGAPGGETPQDVAARADQVIQKIKTLTGRTLLFSHGHFLRLFAARWLGLPPEAASYFVLAVASMSVLGFEKKQPVILSWNQVSPVDFMDSPPLR